MLLTFILALASLSLFAEDGRTADRELSLKASQSLRRGINLTLGEENSATAQSARVIVEVENQMELEQGVLIGARFNVVLDNRLIHALTVGAVGVGEDEAKARENLVLEWLGQCGGPLVYYLTDQPGVEIDGLRVYTGPVGIRGPAPKGWLLTDELHQRIIAALREEFQEPLTVVDLKLDFAEDGVIDGECRINGGLSTQALNRLLSIDWPTESGFLLKQFYIVINPEGKPAEVDGA